MLTITVTDLDPIAATIPPGASSFTIELAPGKARLFTATAFHRGIKKWDGRAPADLSAGEGEPTDPIEVAVFCL